jgi:NAD(P)-dependent dehydrogenase (short-subunit alcohol dehydrogenase family)
VFAGVRRESDAQGLNEAKLPGLRPILFDVTDRVALTRAAEEIDAEVGSVGLSGLVNNAGVSGAGPLEVVNPEEVRRCFEVNVMGPLAVTQALLPMLRRGRGRIVNMSSVGGRVSMPLMSPYCISKFAMESMSDALRMELHRSGIKVSIIDSGTVATPMGQKGNEQIDYQIDHIPTGAPDYYRASLVKLRGVVGQAKGAPAQNVAKVIHTALTTRRPRSRYVVGGDARVLLTLRALFSDRTMDSLFRKLVDL